MNRITTNQDGVVIAAQGKISVEVNGQTHLLALGQAIPQNSTISFEDDSIFEIELEDGTVQTAETSEITSQNDEALAEIEALQDLIASGEDPTEDLPETAAGGPQGNQGGIDVATLERAGNETIADTAFETQGLTAAILEQNEQTTLISEFESQISADSNTITEDSIATGNVLNNDFDADSTLSVATFSVNGQTQSAGDTVTVEGGTLVINADGSYSFTPAQDWNGQLPVITYTTNTGATATLTIEVTPVDDASVLVNDSNTIAEDTVATGNVLTNDSDVDNDLSVVSFTVDDQTITAGTETSVEGGTLVINADGSYSFTPAQDWHGQLPVITFTTNTGATATLTIEVTPVDDVSVLVNDSNTIAEDTIATGNVLTNDNDVDNDLSVVSFTVDGQTITAGTETSVEGGTLVINADGSYSFTPAQDWNGTLPVITYTTSTGSTATLTIEVTPVDDASVLVNDSNTIAEDTVATGNVLTNDNDVDNDLSVVSFTVDGQTITAGTETSVEGGTLVINADGSYSFTPAQDWNGQLPVITYTTNTGATATLTIEVTPFDDGFSDDNEVRAIQEGGTAEGNVIDGESVDGDISVQTFQITGSDREYAADGTAVDVTVDGEVIGSFSLTATGDYVFTPNENWNGELPTITYTLSDGTSTDTSTLDIEVAAVVDGFSDDNEVRAIQEGGTAEGNVIDGESVDGDISVQTFQITGSDREYAADGTSVDVIVDGEVIGSFSLTATGDYVFTPNENWNGEVPTITYTLSDGTS
ncbi:tandem-95 repeat protein, partial [Shewanella sp. 202IG2-18]|uniref:Ig-like domain-containing protein n=1 Tax=Parashewanella hymeniacidonis TaxID=2807618 RepID=UPI0019613DC2